MDVDPTNGVDPTAPSLSLQPSSGAQTQGHQPSPSPQVLKLIRKTEVEVLCHQHNPVSLFVTSRHYEGF